MRSATATIRTLAILVATCLISISITTAKKPDNPGGGGGGGGSQPGLEGVIYFHYQGQAWVMNTDGSAKTPVPNTTSFDRINVSPSHLRHGNQQWLLKIQFQFPGEFYPKFVVDENGDPVLDENGDPIVNAGAGAGRKEIVAGSDGGAAVLLTTQPDLEILAVPVWGIDDVYVSWVARRWDDDPYSPTFGTVLEGGLYVAMLAFDGNGNITGLQQQPAAPLVPLPLVVPRYPIWNDSSTLAPDINDHSWSPDGTQFVFDIQSGAELWICDLLAPPTEAFRLLTDEHSGNDLTRPRWSPAGDKILYEDADLAGAILTINVDGTGMTTIANGSGTRPVFWPFWSPTGSHVLYQRGDYRIGESNIIRANATGGSPANLTRDIFGDGSDQTTLGWR